MSGPGRGRLAGVLSALTVALVIACPAAASTWDVAEIADGPTEGMFFAVSCPSESLCVATGSNSVVATSTRPDGGGSAWKTVHPEGYVDTGGGLYPGSAIRGVSCPTEGFCAAAGHQGHFFTSTDPTGPADAWVETRLGLDATHMNGISCPTPSFCVAVGQNGRIVTTENPSGGAAAWTIHKLSEPFDLRGVSCASASLCVAVGLEGNILSSTNPTGGPGAWAVVRQPAGEQALNGVSCPTSSLCVTANPGHVLSSTDPAGGASAWKVVGAGSGLPVTAASCATERACLAVTNNAEVIASTDPSGGAADWSFENVIPAWQLPSGKENPNGGPNAMFGVSCPTIGFCVAAGQRHQVIFSSDPFAVEKPRNAVGKKTRRPRAVITFHPAKRVDPRRGGARVKFRFRSIGRAASFKCRINKRSLRTCRSPRGYRLPKGNFHFRVYAVGPTGLKGPPARYRFRVGPVLEPGPTPTCEPGEKQPSPSPGVRPCQEPPTRFLTPVVPEYPLGISHPTPGGGTVTSDPPGVSCFGFGCGANFRAGTPVTLTATPNKGFAFSGFSGDCAGPTCSLLMDAPKNVRIDFVRFAVQTRTKLIRNPRNGTAKIIIRVGGPGRAILLGKGIERKVREPATADNLRLPIIPRPSLAEELEETGEAKLTIEVRFTPTNGTQASLTQQVRLIRS